MGRCLLLALLAHSLEGRMSAAGESIGSGSGPIRAGAYDPLQIWDVQCNRLSGCRTASVPAD